MKNRNNFKQFLLGKGMYAALAVCLAAAGTAAWITINNSLSDPFQFTPQAEQSQENIKEPISSLELPEATPEESTPVEQKQPDVSKGNSVNKAVGTKDTANSTIESSSSANSSPSSVVTSESASTSAVSPPVEKSQTFSYALPLNSAVLSPFSGDKLVENTTLKEWRTHNGVDLKAKPGDTVKSACNGTVTAISFDPLWGTTVEVTAKHNNKDYILTYCGLKEELPVKLNDHISIGDNLGSIGTIPCEADMEAHLHFMVQENNQYIDPLSLIAK